MCCHPSMTGVGVILPNVPMPTGSFGVKAYQLFALRFAYPGGLGTHECVKTFKLTVLVVGNFKQVLIFAFCRDQVPSEIGYWCFVIALRVHLEPNFMYILMCPVA